MRLFRAGRRSRLVLAAALAWSAGAVGVSGAETFAVVPSDGALVDGGLLLEQIPGNELTGAAVTARRRVPAMDQAAFPEPESACGPAAILNWLLWLDQERVLRLPRMGSGEVDAVEVFRRIDGIFTELEPSRAENGRGGANLADIVLTMDRLLGEYSGGELRFGVESFEAPLAGADLLRVNRGYRCGILIGRVLDEDGAVTDGPDAYHAVSLVAADRSGGVMLNNWGRQVFGHLRTEGGRQILRAENAIHPPLQVERVLCFRPFRPTAP
jgi:hypothetical protein